MGPWPCWYAGDVGRQGTVRRGRKTDAAGGGRGTAKGAGRAGGEAGDDEGAVVCVVWGREGRREMEVCEDSWRAKGVAPQMGNCELSPTWDKLSTAPRSSLVLAPLKQCNRVDSGSDHPVLCIPAPCRTPLQHHHPPLHFRATSMVVQIHERPFGPICSTYNP